MFGDTNMKWIAKIFGLLFILAGVAVAGFTVETAKNNIPERRVEL